MNEKDFTQAMAILGLAYNKEFTPEQVSVWYEFFHDTNLDVFKQAIKRITSKEKFLPSIAQIKEEIALMQNPILQLNADEEWDKCITTIRKYGRYRKEQAMAALSEHNRNIIRQIGFERICNSENIEWERRLFNELFNNKQDSYEDALLLSEPQMTLAELTRMAEIKALEHSEQLLIGDSE